MSVEINKNLKEYVKSKNIRGAHASIQGLISKDRRLEKFHTPVYVKYAEENLDGFWVEDDGETEFPSKDKWDNELWKNMCVEMEYNFSKKKFDLIIEIMQHLRDSGHPDFQYKPRTFSETSNQKVEEEKRDDNDIVKYAIIGGIMGLAGGAIIDKTIISGIVGTLVGSGAGYLKSKTK